MSKRKIDFSDMSEVDAVRLVINNAVVARDSGHGVAVKSATIKGEQGILVWVPGYKYDGKDIVVTEAEAT